MEARDDDLARRIRRGDRNAFDAFFDGYSGPLLGYLAGMVSDRALAEDLLQETMLRVYRRIDRYQERGAFRSWVFRIATNLALTELRRRRLAATEALDERVLELPSPGVSDPGELFETGERERLVEAGLAILADEQRSVILLRVRHGMEVQEIAHTLCVPEGTVKSRIHHAVRKLREFVEQRDGRTIRGARK